MNIIVVAKGTAPTLVEIITRLNREGCNFMVTGNLLQAMNWLDLEGRQKTDVLFIDSRVAVEYSGVLKEKGESIGAVVSTVLTDEEYNLLSPSDRSEEICWGNLDDFLRKLLETIKTESIPLEPKTIESL